MGFHLFDRRQQWYPAGGGVGAGLGGMADYALRARFLGINPTIPNDLIASMLFSMVFAALAGACAFVGRDRIYRTFPIYTLFAASILSFLGFAIRAGIANSTRPAKTSFIAECTCFVLAQLFIMDVWVMRTRDELVDFLEFKHKADLQGEGGIKDSVRGACFNWETRIAFFSRFILLPLCLILYMVGYFMLPNPANGLPSNHSIALRGGASFLLIFLLVMMGFVMIAYACFEQPPWLPHIILFVTSIMLWLPAMYGFCLVAVVLDSSSLVRSKTFFYVGFGFGHGVAIMALIAMNRVKRIWVYHLGPGAGPEGGPAPNGYGYLPPRLARGVQAEGAAE